MSEAELILFHTYGFWPHLTIIIWKEKEKKTQTSERKATRYVADSKQQQRAGS